MSGDPRAGATGRSTRASPAGDTSAEGSGTDTGTGIRIDSDAGASPHPVPTDADRAAKTAIIDSADAPSHYGERPVTEVAVGVLVDAQDRFLLTSRPAGKVYAGYWEFPGGKLEAGESVEQALRRELQEEIGITIAAAEPWRVLMMDYPHARVRLNFCKVRAWTGEFEMRESQRMAWETLPVRSSPVLPGTIPVLEWFAQERGFDGATHDT